MLPHLKVQYQNWFSKVSPINPKDKSIPAFLCTSHTHLVPVSLFILLIQLWISGPFSRNLNYSHSYLGLHISISYISESVIFYLLTKIYQILDFIWNTEVSKIKRLIFM
ncbi:unnamed protein product (macronuclear) [Paramecium tetraurelia]|uniref:Uncharacterized protein n=1 Tax=Paramecium tetraurelia TaxID=5888 RepID=A0DWI3_PARTE|nr:uncharacterized protein GSPATT00021042001 [Paramecium tetraurelia]CAK87400.1 unnamed protein product [Paramecium tetraurelia]|eukprot:XP_001454797.1 hypothetical protein (macronuclear) [Paramecium tetraurelia strain d4-2]